MTLDELSGAEKVAILLLTLGEEATTRAFQEMRDHEVQQVAAMMIQHQKIPRDLAEQVVEAFGERLETDGAIFHTGTNYVSKLVTEAVGVDRAAMINKLFEEQEEKVRFGALLNIKPQVIARLIREEHPQTLAMILGNLPSHLAGPVLRELPATIQADVVYRLAILEKPDPEILAEVEEEINRAVRGATSLSIDTLGGADVASSILQNASKDVTARVIEELGEADEDLATRINDLLFTFEDLTRLERDAIQAILREVKTDDLVVALKGASTEVREVIFANLSSRASEMLADDLENMPPVRIQDVEEMQKTIVTIVRRLEKDGKISLGGNDAQMV
ncbi:MAG: flagellar motor switch protein FliG [Nitrospirae bacterium CG18_big_fil_WC_8_21_14_2_50_70_55]|nr:flagellar motor switch protein FliG [Deltaproteobacteria bacterium]OIP62046.1 MAG: flagellar motor switch protein FliG [Nitrospirae bacterium CG2_30_70_394]PIQ05832.1 MAG: flagellar motor switch protein FliG [Nitrospirae bacterium CG18_big_fil_WC_8_21_14_2_50_70_55]PIU79627.1 MAG: flagellar motor switch protein FliG [Nitrospirae bacterium CG06_land_8_20_14_3_00_70_43]PIW82917.1 MAG: flagellar motor switch protein FliG [Nitrospirae bacterium CG_4_8_14_3_um_filter_70_85]PIX83820.1 MAG: flagel